MTGRRSPKVFISYRRSDSGGHAGRLCDDLMRHFGSERVFMDLHGIGGGDIVRERIETTLDPSGVLVAVIGRDWLTASENNIRRLDNPKDFVRLEISIALSRGMMIIPVLINGATMPREDDLPQELQGLAQRNGLEISDSRWKYDVDQLIQTIEKALPPQQRQTMRIMVISLVIAGMLIAAMGLWLKKNQQVNSSESNATFTPSPFPSPTTATTPPSITEPTKEKTPVKEASPPTPTPQPSISPAPTLMTLRPPWEYIEKAVRAQFSGLVEYVVKDTEPECKGVVCHQRVKAALMNSEGMPVFEPVMITYELQINGHWKIKADRLNRHH